MPVRTTAFQQRMPRLFDDIRRAEVLHPPSWLADNCFDDWERSATSVMKIITRNPPIPVLLCNNVSEFYYETSGKEEWHYLKDFPGISPPWPIFWTEHRFP